ncbi:MAG: thioredoxin 1 [Kiritimatiellia bacterium]|jgi:thioredoxin 1
MASDRVTDVTDAEFEEQVLNSELPVLVDYWATWCAPCKALAPFVAQVAEENAETLKVVKVDVQRNRKAALKFGVSNLPTLLVIKNGKEVARKVGAGGGVNALRKLVQPHV